MYGQMRSQISEKKAMQLITSMCLSDGVVSVLQAEYRLNGSYPDEKSWTPLVFLSGYPSNLGCGPTSIKNTDRIVDEKGDAFVYQYKSHDEVHVYSVNVAEKLNEVTVLYSGDVNYRTYTNSE